MYIYTQNIPTIFIKKKSLKILAFWIKKSTFKCIEHEIQMFTNTNSPHIYLITSMQNQ